MIKFYHFYLTCAIILSALTFTCCSNKKCVSKEMFKESDSLLNIQEEPIYTTPEESVELMLGIRNEMITNKIVDSTYINMPEEAIIVIVLQNPEFTVQEVVETYLHNQEYYNNILENKKKIEEYKRFIKNKEPDSIPHTLKPDTLII